MQAPAVTTEKAYSMPVGALRVVAAPVGGALYAVGNHLWQSQDGGRSWRNLTALAVGSVVGGAVYDLAIDPADYHHLVIATQTGLWRSRDEGDSWAGLNEGLPNFPGERFAGRPDGVSGVRVLAQQGLSLAWVPGERVAWVPTVQPPDQEALKTQLASRLRTTVTAAWSSGLQVYAGAAGGDMWSSSDGGREWRRNSFSGEITAIWASAEVPSSALALVRSPVSTTRILRTHNAGIFWDDITGNLPAGLYHGLAADLDTGTIYVAGPRGLFQARTDLRAAAPPAEWGSLEGLPPGPVLDVQLDRDAHQLFVLVRGWGVYCALAPHRYLKPALVSAADWGRRAGAPGAVMTLLGLEASAARIANLSAPVLSSSDGQSQVQIPFGVGEGASALEVDAIQRNVRFDVEIRKTAPAIMLDADHSPVLIDSATGMVLEASAPVRRKSRLQILATGLGQVVPEWAAGVPAPAENPPTVAARVVAYLNDQPVPVLRATLAPGFIGLYLVEIELPEILNSGSAELVIEVGGQRSHPARLWVDGR